MGIGQALTKSLFFASNAIYPLALMPAANLSRVNPLTYQVDAQRSLMIGGGSATFGLALGFAFMAAVLMLLVLIASRLYPKIT
jgi:ABC-2 type transport system permease protein